MSCRYYTRKVIAKFCIKNLQDPGEFDKDIPDGT